MPHARTRECTRKAELLIADPSEDNCRYASLQLRMGIEYLFYELLSMHQEQLPDDITKTWKPKQIIDAILECDPLADQDGLLAVLNEGDDVQSSESVQAYESKAPNKRLLRKHYHRLGYYLHAPVDLVLPSMEKWKADLESTIASLKQFKPGLVMSSLGTYVTITCECCGRRLKRNVLGVERTGEMRCPDPKCKALYDIELHDDSVTYQLREVSYDCPYCGTKNSISAGAIEPGLEITCRECDGKVELYTCLSLRNVSTGGPGS